MFECLEAEVKRYNSETGGKAFVQRCEARVRAGSEPTNDNRHLHTTHATCTPVHQTVFRVGIL